MSEILKNLREKSLKGVVGYVCTVWSVVDAGQGLMGFPGIILGRIRSVDGLSLDSSYGGCRFVWVC